MVTVALGSNQKSSAGGPKTTVLAAITKLRERFQVPLTKSALYATSAFPAGSGPDFVNAVVAFESGLAPEAILAALHEIEADFDRERVHRWAPRTLDLDLLFVGDQVVGDVEAWIDLPLSQQTQFAPEGLILPHPRLQDRAFVLVPLADVAPDWRHPVLGERVTAMLDRLPAAARADVRRI